MRRISNARDLNPVELNHLITQCAADAGVKPEHVGVLSIERGWVHEHDLECQERYLGKVFGCVAHINNTDWRVTLKYFKGCNDFEAVYGCTIGKDPELWGSRSVDE